MSVRFFLTKNCPSRKEAYSENLNFDNGAEGLDGVAIAAVQKALHGSVNGESTVDQALGRELHDDQAAGLLASNIDVDFARASLDLGHVDRDLGKVTSLDEVRGTDRSLFGGVGAVQLVDDGGDAGLDLSLALLPVLNARVRVTHALDALDGVGGVELAVGLVERLQGRVGGDGGSRLAVVSRLALVGCGENGRRRHDGLPESPHAVNVGVVHEALLHCQFIGHLRLELISNLQQGVEAGVVRSKELVATSTIPVDGIVNLLNIDARAAGGSEIGKVLGVGQNVVLQSC